jgi:hypothetical protein
METMTRRQAIKLIGIGVGMSLRHGMKPGSLLAQTTMVPLKLYWSERRGDNFTTATAVGEQSAVAAGYQFARIEGHVFSSQQPGTVPLKLYWSEQRGDNFTTATAVGEQSAIAAGYQFARIEGYVFPP